MDRWQVNVTGNVSWSTHCAPSRRAARRRGSSGARPAPQRRRPGTAGPRPAGCGSTAWWGPGRWSGTPARPEKRTWAGWRPCPCLGVWTQKRGKVRIDMQEIRAVIIIKRKIVRGFYSQNNYRGEEKSLTGSLLPFRLSFNGATWLT